MYSIGFFAMGDGVDVAIVESDNCSQFDVVQQIQAGACQVSNGTMFNIHNGSWFAACGNDMTSPMGNLLNLYINLPNISVNTPPSLLPKSVQALIECAFDLCPKDWLACGQIPSDDDNYNPENQPNIDFDVSDYLLMVVVFTLVCSLICCMVHPMCDHSNTDDERRGLAHSLQEGISYGSNDDVDVEHTAVTSEDTDDDCLDGEEESVALKQTIR